MTTQDLVNKYLELLNEGRIAEIYDQLYSVNIVCTEPEHTAAIGVPTITRGIDAVKTKANARRETIAETHSSFCSDAVVGGNYFSVAMGRDLTFKNGERRKLEEIAVFGVEGDKIISETFFY